MFFSASISPKTGAGRLTRWRTQRTRFASKTFQSSTWWSWTSQRQLQSARQTLAKWERSGFSRCGFSGGGGVRYWWDGRDRWDRWDRRKDVQRTLWRHRCNEALWAKLPTQSIHLVHLVHLAWGRTWSAPRAPSEVTSAVAHVAQRWFATGGGNARRPKSVREVGRGLGAQRLAPGAAETCWNWMSYGVWIKWGWKCRIVYVDTGGYWGNYCIILYLFVFWFSFVIWDTLLGEMRDKSPLSRVVPLHFVLRSSPAIRPITPNQVPHTLADKHRLFYVINMHQLNILNIHIPWMSSTKQSLAFLSA